MEKNLLISIAIVIIAIIAIGAVYYSTSEGTSEDITQDIDLEEDSGIDEVFGEDPNTEPPEIPG